MIEYQLEYMLDPNNKDNRSIENSEIVPKDMYKKKKYSFRTKKLDIVFVNCSE